MVVLGLGGWLVVEAATTIYGSRDRFLDGTVAPSQAETRRAAERGVEAIDTRKSRGVVAVLRAIERAQAELEPGDALTERDVLIAYRDSNDGDDSTSDRVASLLSRACRDGLARRRAGKGYVLTEDGKRLLKRDRR